MTEPPPDLSVARKTRLHASGQALLYDIAQRVRSGYHWWTTGELSASKVLAIVAKLDRQYSTSADSLTRHRRKAAEEASATLLVWPLRNDPAGYTTRFGYLLLSSEHLEGEVMYDGRKKPIRVNLYANENAVYHLIPTQLKVARTVRKAGRKKHHKNDAPTETTHKRVTMAYDWQLSAKSLDLMRQRFAHAASHPAALDGLRRAYSALPMVSGYRSQFRGVLRETKVLWRKASTPAVQAAKQGIREGQRPDPFEVGSLPFIRGFPRFYDDPPVTLAAYLDANIKVRREVERRVRGKVQADHPPEGETL